MRRMMMPMAVLMGEGWSTVPAPDAAFSWLPFTIEQRGRVFRPKNWTIESNQPADTKPYYVSMTGDDAAAGTIGAPLRRMKTAAAKADATSVRCLDGGPYDQDTGLCGYIITKTISIIGAPGGTIVTGFYTGISFAIDNGTYPHTYHGSQANASSFAFDAKTIDANGDYSGLTAQASVAAVEAAAGSIYISGSDIYVRLADDRAPDADLKISHSGNDNFRFVPTSGTKTCYAENLWCYGGKDPIISRAATGVTANLYLKGCKSKYSTYNDGAFIAGGVLFVAQNCEIARGLHDGFNYNTYQTQAAHGVEINCIGRHNGTTGNADNGSTAHDAAIAVCLNGQYYGNVGRNVADITNARRWMLGCSVHDSAATDVAYDHNYNVGETAIMWLDSCSSYGSTYGLFVTATGTPGIAYIRNFVASDPTSGTPVAY